MYVIVVGAGKIGYHLARTLISEGHEVTLVEKDTGRAAELAPEFGESLMVGDACEVRVMQDVGMARADCVAAVTGHDEDNLVVCQLAKREFNVPRQISRVNNPKNEPLFHLLGVTETVASTQIIYRLIEQEVETGEQLFLTALRRGRIMIVSVDLTPDSPAAGRQVRGINLPEDAVLAAIVRDDHILLPSGTTTLEPGDTVIGVASPQDEEALRHALLGNRRPGGNGNS